MRLTIELKDDEARTFYDALFRSVSVDDVDVFDSSVCPDEPSREDFSDEFDPERDCETDDNTEQLRLFSDEVSDAIPLYYCQQVIHFCSQSAVVSLTVDDDLHATFSAYDCDTGAVVWRADVGSPDHFDDIQWPSVLFPYARKMARAAAAYLRDESQGMA